MTAWRLCVAKLGLALSLALAAGHSAAAGVADGQAAAARGDHAAAAAIWRPLAEQGDAEAQVELGKLYDLGRGLAADPAQAAVWYRRAAEQGNARGQNNLGALLAEGSGVPRNDALAVQWYRKAAEQGLAAAQSNLADALLRGAGVAPDPVQAAAWHQRAAEQGEVKSQVALANMHLRGNGVPQDDTQAARWFRLAAQQGSVPAQAALGFLFENGRGVAQNLSEAAQWYVRAASQGRSDAQANLAMLFLEGRGVPKDMAKAYALLSTAAAQPNAKPEIQALPQRVGATLSPAQREQSLRWIQAWAQPGGGSGMAADLGMPAAAPVAAMAPAALPTAAPAVLAAPAAPAVQTAPRSRGDAQAAFESAVRGLAPQVSVNTDNPYASDAEFAINARVRCERQYKDFKEPGKFASDLIDACWREAKAARTRAASAGGAAAGTAQRPAPPGGAAAAAPYVASNEPRAVFGLLVGSQAPRRAPTCEEGFNDRPLMPADAPFCISKLGTGLEMLMGELFGLGSDDYKAMGIVPVDIRVNDKLYDTTIATGATMFIHRESNVLQSLKLEPLLVASDKVLAMLTRKFGKPTRQTQTTWTNRQTGAVVGRTPNYVWSLPDLRVEFESKVADVLDNSPTAVGRIEISTVAYLRIVEERQRAKDAPPPGRKPM